MTKESTSRQHIDPTGIFNKYCYRVLYILPTLDFQNGKKVTYKLRDVGLFGNSDFCRCEVLSSFGMKNID
jgi:hypothetical protein